MLKSIEIDVLMHELLTIATTDCTDEYYDNDYDCIDDFYHDINDKIDNYKNNAMGIIKLCNDYDLHLKFIGRSRWENEKYNKLYYDNLDNVFFGDDDLIHLIDNNDNVVMVINDFCQCIDLNRYDLSWGKYPKYKLNVINETITDKYNIIDME